MPAPKGNQNARKSQAKDSRLDLRCRKAERERWDLAAARDDSTTAWAIHSLNAAADRELDPLPVAPPISPAP